MRPPVRFSRPTSGFSLVEVVLALGIIGFAFTTILGLLSVGMSTFRDAIESTVRSKIVADLTNRATQTEFTSLSQFAEPVAATDLANAQLDPSQAKLYYYTDEGVELTGTGQAANSIYTVAVFYLPASSLPGSTSPSANLATVRLDVYATRGSALTASSPGRTTTLVRVANFGQRL